MAQSTFHPGEHLQEELDALSMSASTLATHLALPLDELTAVLRGERSVSAELALRLGHFFGTSAQFWLNLQVLFDLEIARQAHGAEIDRLPTLQAA
jgi:antitoxin HigA-1